MAKRKAKARSGSPFAVRDIVVTARNKSGDTLHQGEVVLIRGFGQSPDDGGWELEVVRVGSGVLLPAFSAMPMRPVVAMSAQRGKNAASNEVALPQGQFFVPDLALPEEVSRHFAFWNLAAMLSLAMLQFGRPTAGKIRTAFVDNFLPEFHLMAMVAAQELDGFLGEVSGRRDRVKTRTRLTDLDGWAYDEAVERFGTGKKGPLNVPEGIVKRAIRLAETGTWIKEYGREIILASKASRELDDTEENILRLLLREDERLLDRQIAERLARPKGSISGPLSRLAKLGYLHPKRRKGYRLTDEGRRIASELPKRRRRSP